MRVAAALKGVSVLAFDASAVIDYAENRARSMPCVEPIFRRLRAGDFAGVGSNLLMPEVVNYAREQAAGIDTDPAGVEARYRALLALLRLSIVTDAIADKATDFRRDYRLKTPDAIHLATAIELGAEAFVTADSDFLRAQGIPIGNPGGGRVLRIIHAPGVTA